MKVPGLYTYPHDLRGETVAGSAGCNYAEGSAGGLIEPMFSSAEGVPRAARKQHSVLVCSASLRRSGGAPTSDLLAVGAKKSTLYAGAVRRECIREPILAAFFAAGWGSIVRDFPSFFVAYGTILYTVPTKLAPPADVVP